MPLPRLVFPDGGCYHCVSRIVGRSFFFGDAEKEFFVSTMRRLEAFLDVRVLTYCAMSNHFHLLVEIPVQAEVVQLDISSLRDRLPLLYRGAALEAARDEIDRAVEQARKTSDRSTWIDEIVARYQARMGNLSEFLKELKWRFSRWYNARNQRSGTLWEARFKSVLIQGSEHALMTVAAYIELNPVRAGLVADPKDYRWCGYGEAVAGKKLARSRLAAMHGRTRPWQCRGRRHEHGHERASESDEIADAQPTWREVAASYRMLLFGAGERREADFRSGKPARPGFDRATVETVIDGQGGKLTLPELLRRRVRYFTDGAVLGSAEFVDRVFEDRSSRFGSNRKSGARKMRGGDWEGLTVMRDLSKEQYL